jgi:hypothetical protein
MRALLIDEEASARACTVVAYARQRQHWYLVGDGGKTAAGSVPGDNPRHVAQFFDGYRTAFSFTRAGGKLYRHLTISVPSKLPNPIAAFQLAELFGFTGWNESMGMRPSGDWIIGPHKSEHCVVIVQEVNEEAL